METPELIGKIKEFFRGDIAYDEKTLDFYSHDTSLFEVRPQLVVFPKDAKDIESLVKFVSENKEKYPNLSITARSGGTDMTGGAINESIIMDFSRYFKKIGEVEENGTEVEPGVFYRDFEKETLKKNLLLPSYPASRNICALGGMVNNNSGGEKTLAHGKTINYVTRLKMVLSDGKEYEFAPISKEKLDEKMKQKDYEGEIYRKIYDICEKNYDLVKDAKPNVSKNSTGYNIWDVWDREKEIFDLTKIFIGAQGTLGINVATEVGLIHAKKHNGLLIIYLDDIKIFPHLINDVLAHKPESFEVFDDKTLGLAIRFIPQFIQLLGFSGTISMGMQFLPNLFRFAFKGLPKYVLLVEFDGDEYGEIKNRLDNLKSSIAKYPIRMEEAENDRKAKNFWTIRRESFNLLRKNVKNKHTAPFIDDLIVRPEKIVEFFPRLTAILKKHGIFTTLAGHIGDGNFHIIPLMDFSLQSEKEKIPIVEEEVNNLVFEFKGSISAEHNEGLIRGYYIKKMYGEKMFDIFRDIKKLFDPKDIFNPHKKTDANQKYSLAHIRDHF